MAKSAQQYHFKNREEATMRPLNRTLHAWRQKMLILQRLATLAMRSARDQSLLKKLIIQRAMRNPLLRIVMIDGEQYVAHRTQTSGKRIVIRGNDNPLENNSAWIGGCRARMNTEETELILDLNEGFRVKDRVGHELDKALERLGCESIDPLGMNLKVTEQYSHLLHMTIPSHGSAFDWKPVMAHAIDKFKGIQIVQRRGDKMHSMPTFDIILSSQSVDQ
ncbi:TPA: hypothetical protein DDZ49_05035 [Candidatus Wolfebacteria bacterium]|uniref:Uncharacterized protein n=2 Tax=Candidatus Wolfeibacteriota TaxID=1752735 RepID=A0A0G1WIS1_9BACT|nr:MAG: hypothetical protein UX70_C0001G0372 [Candidatus Wolfebacteria bacterium GW2011_GWB1_47_1]KKU42579.1 MAG: hypothetical protein UX58_C0001G0011 [Candidatus Wolfebacteria bacterium GW2011_GWB2_46_69]KKU54686.1 MAG: hypothetical protein UX76_C0001G0145 [Candidatus Wolfebacteria bacterium GW2011_GWC1_47_103]KKU66478.1 MAG: hypothetical protein UX90_C0001G0537 [Candidatus Wolfebacteria bacterium GW2011_GWD2_47_17]KKU90208.1 MAG: hypothetical protein UY19_C0005G0011 [Candidatus Wolfebacteria 